MAIERLYKLFPAGVKDDTSSLTAEEITCLELYHFSNLFFHEIYKLVFKPTNMSDPAIRRTADKLLSSKDAQQYLETRRAQVENFISHKTEEVASDFVIDEDILDENGNFTPEVLRRVKIQAGREVLKKGNVDSKIFEKLFDFLIKNSKADVSGERPIRVLGEQCRSCRYRIHAEENYEDVCKICRYQLNSEQKFDHKTQFIIPQKQE